MKTLEKTLGESDPVTEEVRPLLVEKPIYEGLRKIEDSAYQGGTSIRYWM